MIRRNEHGKFFQDGVAGLFDGGVLALLEDVLGCLDGLLPGAFLREDHFLLAEGPAVGDADERVTEEFVEDDRLLRRGDVAGQNRVRFLRPRHPGPGPGAVRRPGLRAPPGRVRGHVPPDEPRGDDMSLVPPKEGFLQEFSE